jgi:hypothetical protein
MPKRKIPGPRSVPKSEIIRKQASNVLEVLDEDEEELASELRAFERGKGTGAGAAWLGRKHSR